MSESVLDPPTVALDTSRAPAERYRIIRRIAWGGMGEIHLARMTLADGSWQTVVLKRLPPSMMRDPEALRSFYEEARIASMLAHKNIARIYEFGEIEKAPFLSMEFIRGASMGQMLERLRASGRRMPLPYLLRIMINTLEALEYAHEFKDEQGKRVNIVHRDVSPENILVTYDGEVKLIDFGLARAEGGQQTKQRMLKGKVAYMSPEQLKHARVDARSDLFALGVVTFEVALDQHPFGADKNIDVVSLVDRVVDGLPTSPSDIDPKFPQSLSAFLIKALKKDPAERFLDAHAMRLALEACVTAMGRLCAQEAVARFVRHLLAEGLRTIAEPSASPPSRSQNVSTPSGAGAGAQHYDEVTIIPEKDPVPLPVTPFSNIPDAATLSEFMPIAAVSAIAARAKADAREEAKRAPHDERDRFDDGPTVAGTKIGNVIARAEPPPSKADGPASKSSDSIRVKGENSRSKGESAVQKSEPSRSKGETSRSKGDSIASKSEAVRSKPDIAVKSESSKPSAGGRSKTSARRAPDRPEMVGSKIGPYLLERRLANGSHAEVYLARTPKVGNFDKPVAVKIYFQSPSDGSEFGMRLLSAAKRTARLMHANIVSILDVILEEHRLSVIMDYVPGWSLAQIFERAREVKKEIPIPIACRLVRDIAVGLAAAHMPNHDGRGAIALFHGDLKPENILVSCSGSVHITDFGVAEARVGVLQTFMATIPNKALYSAPELLMGEIGASCDVFSAGVLLHEALSLQPMFVRNSAVESLVAVIQNRRTPVSSLRPAVPTALDAILDRATAFKVPDRYESAHKLELALDMFAAEHRLQVTSEGMMSWLSDLFPKSTLNTDPVTLFEDPTNAGMPHT